MKHRRGLGAKQINENIKLFREGFGKYKGLKPKERYASFDYCFNYFQAFRKRNKVRDLASRKHMELSCLHVAFYLASWGMFRPSSFLLQKSVKFYEPLIREIAKTKKELWKIDVNSYDDKSIETLLGFGKRVVVSLSLGKDVKRDTLVTKIMLGVFGNVPAFDSNFKRGFGKYIFGERSLKVLKKFYELNKSTFENQHIYTIDFTTGKRTGFLYTNSKLIDMVGFVEGLRKTPPTPRTKKRRF
jgi:hypothetical protein